MNYYKVYNYLYNKGYHKDLKNHGTKFVDYLLDNYSFSSLLEIGCSQGAVIKQFKEKGIDSHGIDVSSIAIEESKKIGLSTCRVGSVVDLLYKDNRFDVVFSCDALEHLVPEDVDKSIREIKRVSTKYLFLKIAFGKEKNTGWAKVLRTAPEFEDIDRLHQTIQNKEWWKDKIEDEDWKFVNDDFQGLMVFCYGVDK